MDATAARRDVAEQTISNIEDKLMEHNEAKTKRETTAKEQRIRRAKELEKSVTH